MKDVAPNGTSRFSDPTDSTPDDVKGKVVPMTAKKGKGRMIEDFIDDLTTAVKAKKLWSDRY